jgi:hypothetical protein
VFDKATQKNITLHNTQTVTLREGRNRLYFIEGERRVLDVHPMEISWAGQYWLDDEQVALNGIEMYVEQGPLKGQKIWTQVPDAFLIFNNTPSFSTHRFHDGRTLVKFCPGFYLPDRLNGLKLSYMITSGADGNISTSAELKLPDIYSDDITQQNLAGYTEVVKEGVRVNSMIETTIKWSRGGKDKANIEEIRSKLGSTGNHVKTLVLPIDYADAAKEVEFVVDCVVKDFGNMYKQAFFIADKASQLEGVSLTQIQQQIEAVYDERIPAFTHVTVAPVFVRPISVEMEVYLNRNELDTSGLDKTIRDFINEFFDYKRFIPGTEFNRMELQFKVEMLSKSIAYTIMIRPTSDLRISWNEIVDIQEITLSFHRAGGGR